MSDSIKVDTSALDKLIDRLSDPQLRQQLHNVITLKGLVAIVAQAIADNFDKEGPGWAPLKPNTIRQSVSKKLRKVLSKLGDKELTKKEAKSRKNGEEPSRRILDRGGFLKKTVTTPNATVTAKEAGSKKTTTGSNIYKIEGDTLIWGTNLIYAGIHNKGGKVTRHARSNIRTKKEHGESSFTIPKREFLVIRPEWQQRLNEFIVMKYIEIIKKSIGGK